MGYYRENKKKGTMHRAPTKKIVYLDPATPEKGSRSDHLSWQPLKFRSKKSFATLSYYTDKNLPQKLFTESVAEAETDRQTAEVFPVCKVVVKRQVAVAKAEIEEYSIVCIYLRTDQSVCRRGNLERPVRKLLLTDITHTENGTRAYSDIWIESFEPVVQQKPFPYARIQRNQSCFENIAVREAVQLLIYYPIQTRGIRPVGISIEIADLSHNEHVAAQTVIEKRGKSKTTPKYRTVDNTFVAESAGVQIHRRPLLPGVHQHNLLDALHLLQL